MPSGKVHATASLLLVAGFSAGTVLTKDFGDFEYALGALLGVIFTPDLDVDKGYIADTYIRKRLGKVAHAGWSATWHFYRRSIKHGSELSHFPVIGTLARIAYLFFFAIILPTYALSFVFPQINMQYEMSWWTWRILSHWKVIVGLMSSDFHHYVMDISTVNNKFSLGSLIHRKTNYHKKVRKS